MNNTAKPKKHLSVLATLLFLTLLALLLSTAGVTLARYFGRTQGSGAAVAKPFYFSSDKLAEDFPYYQIDEPADGADVELSFTLSNFVDRLRRTDGTLHYTYWAVSGTDVSGTAIPSAKGSGELAGMDFETTPEIVLTLSRADFGGEGVVTVLAESTSPYEKTIGAQFGFAAGKRDLQYMVSEQGDAVVVELGGGDGRSVTVSWPETLSPDLSNPVFQNSSPGTVTFTVEVGIRYALTFLKTDPTLSYTEEDFQVIQP